MQSGVALKFTNLVIALAMAMVELPSAGMMPSATPECEHHHGSEGESPEALRSLASVLP